MWQQQQRHWCQSVSGLTWPCWLFAEERWVHYYCWRQRCGGGHCRRKQVFQLTLKASRVVAASNTLVFFGPYFLFLETSYISCVESVWKKIYLCHRKGLDQSSYINKVQVIFEIWSKGHLKGSAEMSSIISCTIEIIYVIELAQCWLMTQASIIYFESD